jgi:hypothetical protein
MVMKLCGLPITSGLVQGPRGTRLETVAVVTLRHSTNSPLMTDSDISVDVGFRANYVCALDGFPTEFELADSASPFSSA